MLWEDFVKQSKVDLRRSCLLFAEGDYGASAYSCQQALEKYLKAYLMKHNLLNNNPSEIGHMKMSKLLRIITVRTESVVQKFSREGELKIIPLLQARQELRHLENSLKRLQPPSGSEDSELLEFKLELWKRSLQMPIKVKYEKELEEIKAQVHDRLWPIAEKIVQYHQEEVRPIYEKFSDAQKRAVAEKYFQDWGFHNEVITEIIRGNIPSMELDKLYLYY
ncbi:MAG: HEPN domain-containing protein, partial [Nitrososphaera sp.]